LQAIHLLNFLWPSLFVSLVMVLAIDLLLDFCGDFAIRVGPMKIYVTALEALKRKERQGETQKTLNFD
jgi:hypothetical protein